MNRLIIFVALLCTSCALSPRDFGFEGVASVETPQEGVIVAELILRNNSTDTLKLRSGEIAAKIKGDAVMTLTLVDEVVVPPVGTVSRESQWQLRQDDPTTIYAMRHRPIEHYLDKIEIDYTLEVSTSKRDKTLGRKGIKASKLDINIEQILRQ